MFKVGDKVRVKQSIYNTQHWTAGLEVVIEKIKDGYFWISTPFVGRYFLRDEYIELVSSPVAAMGANVAPNLTVCRYCASSSPSQHAPGCKVALGEPLPPLKTHELSYGTVTLPSFADEECRRICPDVMNGHHAGCPYRRST